MIPITHMAAVLWGSFTLLARTNARVLRNMARNWKAELGYLAATYAVVAAIFHLPPLA